MAFGNYEFPHSHNYDSDLRELIALVKGYRDDYERILSTIDKIVAEFDIIQEEFNALSNKVNEMYEYIDDEIKTTFAIYEAQMNIRLRKMQDEIDAAYDLIATILPAAKAYADAKDEIVKAELRNEMQTLLEIIFARLEEIEKEIEQLGLIATNPLTGYKEPVNIVIESIAESYKVHALTNNEYEDLDLTNTQYASYQLYDKQYIVEGKKLLQRKWLNRLNPATGQLTRESNVNSWIATMCANTLTVSEYVAQDLTNEEYANLQLTNLDYFFTQAADLPWA